MIRATAGRQGRGGPREVAKSLRAHAFLDSCGAGTTNPNLFRQSAGDAHAVPQLAIGTDKARGGVWRIDRRVWQRLSMGQYVTKHRLTGFAHQGGSVSPHCSTR